MQSKILLMYVEIKILLGYHTQTIQTESYYYVYLSTYLNRYCF